jgi:hypothetical protein
MNTDKHGFNTRKRREQRGEGRSWERGIADLRFEFSKLKNMDGLQNFYAQ